MPRSLPILLLLFVPCTVRAYPGPILPPKEVAKEVYGRFRKAINSGDKVEIQKFISPTLLETAYGQQLLDSITQEIGGYSRFIEYAYYELVPGPEINIWTINSTLNFRGPEPEYNRKNYEIILENMFVNPQLEPLAWQVRSMKRKVKLQRKSFMQQGGNQGPEIMIGNVLNEFFTAVNYMDTWRLQNIVDINESISPTGMQQLHDLLVFNVFEIRSSRVISNNEVSSTVVCTNQQTRYQNLFWFVFKNQKEDRMWRITDMKMMFTGYGVPKDFIEILREK